jgi:hypothetical protein
MRAIIGEEKLKAIYGAWPSFHDAEVWSLAYERVPDGFSVVAVIHAFQMTSEVDARGFYVLKHHTKVRIRFHCCSDVSLDGFNHQNVLFGLDIKEPEQATSECSFEVRFDTSYGLAGNFKCKGIVVEDVQPWTPPFGVYAEQAAPPNSGPAIPVGNSGATEGPPPVS